MGSRGVLCGARVKLNEGDDAFEEQITAAMDFITIPTPWRLCEPEEGVNLFDQVDNWMSFAVSEKIIIHAGPLVSFAPSELPEWAHVLKNDFDTLKSRILTYVERVVSRYADKVKVWNVASGLHCVNTFDLNFDQISDLTRSICQHVKGFAPQSQVMIDLPIPWGEYYARNQRTIPPLLFADMVYQNDMKFDAFGLPIEIGIPEDGHFVRDFMEISARLDEFTSYGKIVHITSCQAPSSEQSDTFDAWGGRYDVRKAGRWHDRWSPQLQAEWLQAVYRLAASRGGVESICWRDLADTPGHYIPNGGLLDAQGKQKMAYHALRNFHESMQNNSSPQSENEAQT